MDDKRFRALVQRLEAEERARPSLYRMRVGLLAALGYAYIGLVLLVLLALLAVTVAIMVKGHAGALIKLVFALVVAAWFILRALWVRFEPPAGRRLTRAEAPALFAEADEIARKLKAPRADVVLLDTDYNASVSQIPRLGMLGFPRNYLCIGMPLLVALPHAHVRAVLAHEFAHLSHAHGKFGAWCYRIRITWLQLLHALEAQRHWTARIFRWFFHWYVPLFSAYTFVLMRRHELEADDLAAEIVGRKTMAQTLVDLEVRGELLSKQFWSSLWDEARQQSSPP
ncbi:MAG TPA: M48 family metallopeptidase, partial [Gemmatimonadaceae bacterium]